MGRLNLRRDAAMHDGEMRIAASAYFHVLDLGERFGATSDICSSIVKDISCGAAFGDARGRRCISHRTRPYYRYRQEIAV